VPGLSNLWDYVLELEHLQRLGPSFAAAGLRWSSRYPAWLCIVKAQRWLWAMERRVNPMAPPPPGHYFAQQVLVRPQPKKQYEQTTKASQTNKQANTNKPNNTSQTNKQANKQTTEPDTARTQPNKQTNKQTDKKKRNTHNKKPTNKSKPRLLAHSGEEWCSSVTQHRVQGGARGVH
jgi:hypothetical protein